MLLVYMFQLIVCVLSAAVNKRRMHPSVVQWETFNEGGGMSTSEFVGEMVALVNKIDPTRPVDSASGGRDLTVRGHLAVGYRRQPVTDSLPE